MIKALLILLIFYKKTKKQANLSLDNEMGGKYHYEINVFLKYTLDTIIGTLEILRSKIYLKYTGASQ